MPVCDCLVCFGVPVGVSFFGPFEVFAFSDKLVPHFEGVLEPVPKNIQRPIVRSPFFVVDDMDRYF